jgi:hypothetical protein
MPVVHEIETLDAHVVTLDDGSQQTFPGVRSSWFGDLPAPRTLADLWNLLALITASNIHIAGWRGQSNLAWPIDSSAVRRVSRHGGPPVNLVPMGPGAMDGAAQIDKDDPAALEYYLQRYESYLLNSARRAGHGFQSGRELNDLELLAVLQHHGAATRLLDFSRNAAVALWFASSENPADYGLLIAIESHKTKQLISEADLTKTIREIVLLQDYPWTFAWQPRHLFERMRVQQSFFLFSKVERREWGSLSLPGPKQANGGLRLIAICPELKSEVAIGQHERMFGFTGLGLFPDLEGFSRFQSAGTPYYA